MTADTENLVLEHLRHIRRRVDDIDERLVRVETQITSRGRQVGELTSAYYSAHGDIDLLRRRVERIERRLELREDG